MSGLSHRLPGGQWVNKLSLLPSLPLPSPEGAFAVCEAALRKFWHPSSPKTPLSLLGQMCVSDTYLLLLCEG